MDPDAARERIVEALRSGDNGELNYAIDDLATWLQRGGFPPEAGPIKVTAAQRRRLGAEAPGRVGELDALNKALEQRQQPEENPGADVHRLEAGQALVRGEAQVAKARGLFQKGKVREAFDTFVVAVALTAVATKETLHSGTDTFSESQYARVTDLNKKVADLRRSIAMILPKKKRASR